MRDVMDCRSPARCASCEHLVKGACALELAVAAVLAPPRAAPVRIPVLAVRDARAAA